MGLGCRCPAPSLGEPTRWPFRRVHRRAGNLSHEGRQDEFSGRRLSPAQIGWAWVVAVPLHRLENPPDGLFDGFIVGQGTFPMRVAKTNFLVVGYPLLRSDGLGLSLSRSIAWRTHQMAFSTGSS